MREAHGLPGSRTGLVELESVGAGRDVGRGIRVGIVRIGNSQAAEDSRQAEIITIHGVEICDPRDPEAATSPEERDGEGDGQRQSKLSIVKAGHTAEFMAAAVEAEVGQGCVFVCLGCLGGDE